MSITEITTPCPTRIKPGHWREWTVESGISPQITALNLRYHEGQSVIELLAGDALDQLGGHADQYATAPVRRYLQRYAGPSEGGWGVFSLDPEKGYRQGDYFRFKPDAPHHDERRGRDVKYEGPAKTQARAMFLRVGWAESAHLVRRLDPNKYEDAINAWRQRLWRNTDQTQKEARQTAISLSRYACERGPIPPSLSTLEASGNPEGDGLQRQDDRSLWSLLYFVEDEGFWPWVEQYNLPIAITEGEKKAGALLTHGIAAISIPGIRNAVRTRDKDGTRLHRPYLIPDLARFATKEREVTICFDYEPRTKQRRELDHEIEKIKTHFGYKRAKTRVLELPGPEKGVDDYLVAVGADTFIKAYDNAPTFEMWTVIRHSRLSYKPDILLNQRYLGDLEIPESAKLVAIKSPKGTGKTESFRNLVEAASAVGQRTLLVTHRVQLGQAICDRVYLPYVTELRTSQQGDLMGYGVCVDSLHPNSQARFNAKDWDDALVIIDEAEQVIWHLLSGTTEIKNCRLEVINQLRVLLDGVMNSDRGRVILSDADLSNQSVRFVLDLLDPETRVKPFVVVNDYKPQEPWQIYHYRQHRPEQWCSALLHHLSEGGKPFICTQSQKTNSRWSTTTLETLIKERFPKLKVLRIDSQSVADPQHEAYNCTAHLNEILGSYDVVICSPTIETGVSIDIRGHFTSLWGCAQGVLSENSTRQFLARLRDPVPRHLWLQSFGVSRIGNGSTSVKGLLAAEYRLAKKQAQILSYADFGEEMLSSHSRVLTTWAVMGCRINAGAVHYRDAVLWGLQQEGHSIIDVTEETHVDVTGCARFIEKRLITEAGEVVAHDVDKQAIKAELDTIKERQHTQSCETTAVAEEISESQYKKLKSQKAKTQEQWHQERKYEVHDRYQVEVTPELVAKDSDGWYPQLRLYYYLLINRESLKERDRAAFESQTSSGSTWLPSLNKSQLGLKIAALETLGIRRLMDTNEEFNGGTRASEAEAAYRQNHDDCHPILWEVAEAARQWSWEIRAILGLTISEKMSPIQIAQALLKKLGLKLECVGQFGGRGERQRYYRYRVPKDGRAEIIGQWLQLDQTRNDSAVHTPGNKEHYTSEVAA